MNFNVLDDCSEGDKQNLKLDYLEQEKSQLNVQCSELALNNQVLRNVITALTKQLSDKNSINLDEAINKLILRNKDVQSKFIGLQKQIQEREAELFLTKQVNIHTEKETHQIIHNYEQKILQLRKLIQSKQYEIQQYEKAHPKLEEVEQVIIPPYSCSVHFFSEFEEYKRIINDYDCKLKELQRANSTLQEKNTTLQKNIRMMENILQSRCSYQDYIATKSTKRGSSQPKFSHFNYTIEPKYNLTQTTQSTISKTLNSLPLYERGPIIRKLIIKMAIEKKQLKEKVTSLSEKNKVLMKTNDALVSSNNFYRKKRKQINEALKNERRYYVNVLDYVLRRSNKLEDLPVLVQDDISEPLMMKKKIQKQLVEQKKQTDSSDYKSIWQLLRDQVNKLVFDETLQQKPRAKRSYSSVGDYSYCQPTAYIAKKKPLLQQSFNIAEKQLKQDFSIIVGGTSKYNFGKLRNIHSQELQFMFDDI